MIRDHRGNFVAAIINIKDHVSACVHMAEAFSLREALS